MAMARRKLVLYLVGGLLLCGLLPSAVCAADNSCLVCHQPHLADNSDCTLCHGGNPRSTRQDIAHDRMIPARLAYFRQAEHPVVVRGGQLLQQLGCRRCHLIGGQGNRLATDLDHLPPRVTAVDLEQAIDRPALFMPQFPLTKSDLAALVNALLAERSKASPVTGQQPRVVHFTPLDTPTPRVFTRQCGSCHQLLSAVWGVLGEGRVAPNLSGLLTPFYPTPLRDQEPWSANKLKRWLDNPRQFRPTAKMPPRPQTLDDWEKLVLELVLPPARQIGAQTGQSTLKNHADGWGPN